MVQSMNSQVDLTEDGTSFLSLPSYGKIMVGNHAFEFYNDRDPKDYIQIPWEEVDKVIASVMFKGKWIPRFSIRTKHNGTYIFAAKQPKRVLRAVGKYIKPENMVRSLTFFQVMRRGLATFRKKK